MTLTAAAEREQYRRFAALLAYPTAALAPTARASAAALGDAAPEAAALLAAFAAFVETTPPGRIEEIYSGTFDLNATAPPYVGYHLFGESYKRSVFLLELGTACRAAGVERGTELADHLALVLALVAATADEDLRAELLDTALPPALERMTAPAESPAPDGDEAPPADAVEGRAAYGLVLRALGLVLTARLVTEGGSR